MAIRMGKMLVINRNRLTMGTSVEQSETDMQMLTAFPSNQVDLKSTRERFNLRHKWARKTPTLPDGTKVRIDFYPKYGDWCRTEEKLDSFDVSYINE